MNNNEKNILLHLSQVQQEAVTYIDGPLLILAGAGSGKTRVLTHKIAWLVSEGIADPEKILAVTFTNKAAGEMRNRIRALLPEQHAPKIQAGTFHAFGLRMLFRHIRAAGEICGIHDGFTVLDRQDCRALMKELMKELNFPEENSDPAGALEIISRDYMAWSPIPQESSIEDENIYKLSKRYRQALRQLNAVDFDDLMILPLEILRQDLNIRRYEQERIDWLLVDEYQDVNRAQYLLLKYLVGDNCTINVVGDPDQSIYGWRGAEIGMILNFASDFEGAKTIILDENYRSTANILSAANALIRNNTARLKKNLHTKHVGGEKIYTLLAQNDFQEADFIVQEIERLTKVHGYDYGNIAILYRQNAMSRLYENKFLENDIPYRVIRGLSFYDRMEVRDVLSILRLALNPLDRAALERAAGFAIKGMGPKRRAEWEDWLASQEQEFSDPLKVWSMASGGAWPVKGPAGESVKTFATHMCAILAMADDGIKPAVDYVWNDMNYDEYLKLRDPENYQDRRENVMELKSIVPEGNLSETLAEAALFTDADKDEPDLSGKVGLLTLHASKGLEFPVVFIVGLEEDIFPHSRAKNNSDELEEERRLCYVGMTRAEERLYLTAAKSRRLYGKLSEHDISRFIFEIPDNCKKTDDRGSRKTEKFSFSFGNRDSNRRKYYGNNYYGGYRGW